MALSGALTDAPPRRGPRSRPAFGAAVMAVVALGLASRSYRSALPPFLGAYAGDTLWALMVFLLGAALWPRATTRNLALGVALFALAIEVSQLYHAPWIEALREARLGGLALGYDFVWSDLPCYAAGVALGAAADLAVRWRSARSAGYTRRP